MRKYFPIIISFLFLFISILLWDKIKLPYDAQNLIVGEHFLKKSNPQNDLIRFIFLLVPSVLIYLISYLKINKSTYSFNKNAKDYFLKNLSKGKENKILNKYFFFSLF